MKKNSLLKLLVLTLAAAMLLSMFVACDNTEDPTETPTDAPTEAPTDAPTEAPTDAPTEEATTAAPTEEATTEAPTEEATTEAPTEEATTEAPTEEATTEEATTEAPTEEATTEEATTEAPTDEATTEEPTEAPTDEATTEKPTEAPTEAETEYAPAIESEIKDDYTYIISMTQENVDGKILYLNGEMDGYYMATTEDFNAAIVVRAAATEGGFNLFYYVDTAKVYINIVEKVDGEKTHYNAVYSDEAVSVWTYDATLGTIVTKVGEKTFYLGTYNEYTTFSATDAEKYPDNFKATLRVPEKCVHAYAYSEEGHWKIACARCEKAAGSVKEHYYIEHTVNGDVIVEACTVCGYVVPMPDSIQWLMYDASIQGTKVGAFQLSTSTGEDEDGTKYRRYSGQDKAAQSIWGRKENLNPINVGDSKYLVIKVRASGEELSAFQLHIGANVTEPNLNKYGRVYFQNILTLGEWTWVVVDLEKALVVDGVDRWEADADGNYVIDYMMFHTDNFSSKASYDFATMAFVSDWEGVEWVMDGAAEYEFVTENRGTGAHITRFNGAALEAEGVIKGYKLKHTVNDDMTITWDPDDDVGQYILTRTNPVVNANFKLLSSNTKYLVIKVKKTDKEDADVQPSDFAVGLSSFGHTNNPTVNLGTVIGTDWTTIVVDLATIPGFLDAGLKEAYTGDTGEFEGKTALRQLQVTMNSTTAVYDVAFFAFVDDWAPIASLAGSEKAYFTGKSAENSNATDPVAVNAKDGSEWVEPAVVLDADFFTKHEPRVDWALSASVAEDGSTRLTSTAGTAAEQCLIMVGRDGTWDKTINVATAKFLVFKVKGSRADLKGYMLLGTGDGVAATAGHKTLYVDYTTEYTTYVVNLEELHGDWNATDGNYIIDKFSYVINFEAADKDTAYVDVAYTAFATTWAQVAELVDVNTVKYATTIGTSSADSILASAKDQDITVDPTATPTPTNVKVNAASYGTLWQGTVAAQKEGDVPFQRFTTTAANSTCQLIWRDPWRNGAATPSPSPIDVKTCGMFVMTYKTSTFAEGASMTVRFSTVETELVYNAEGGIAGDNAQRIVFTTAAVSEWTTVVVDLKTVNHTFVASADGTFKVDDLTLETFGLAMGEYVDIAYMGFVENWAGVDYVVDVENVVEITNIDGTNATVAIADKVAAEQTPEA